MGRVKWRLGRLNEEDLTAIKMVLGDCGDVVTAKGVNAPRLRVAVVI